MKMKRTHKGLMYGIVPVYLDFTIPQCPGVEGRFWGCETLLTACDLVFEVSCFLISLADPDFEPMFPIKITGVLDWDGPDISGVQ